MSISSFEHKSIDNFSAINNLDVEGNLTVKGAISGGIYYLTSSLLDLDSRYVLTSSFTPYGALLNSFTASINLASSSFATKINTNYSSFNSFTASFSGSSQAIAHSLYDGFTASFSASVKSIGDTQYVLTASVADQKISGTLVISGNLNILGGVRGAQVEKLAQYTLLASDYFIKANATSGSFGLVLPTAINSNGKQFVIKKVDATANAVIVSCSLGQTIDNSASVALSNRYDAVSLFSDGANWLIY
jgi:hypothetical protein